jgi:L-aspartate oxidase
MSKTSAARRRVGRLPRARGDGAPNSASVDADLVVVGAGVAGLTAALAAASEGAKVIVVTAGRIDADASASALAQGGVAAATAPGDAAELHRQDTLAAGRALCRESAVDVLVHDAPVRVAELRSWGVPLDPELGLEGGHSRRRIHHVAGADTGRWILDGLARRSRVERAIEIAEGEPAVALWPGQGITTLRREVRARAVIVAAGGYAALWSRTTHPPGSNGAGIVLAYRAGAALSDLEFVQFHPTVLAGSSLLLSEALRGEGALLVDDEGRRFTDELAPRDVVARAVATRPGARLDLRPVPQGRFPTLMRRLAEADQDPPSRPVPVEAAAHFTVGGIATDVDGRTTVAGLYAAGEAACTGVHGANRLASNSLAECLVFGRRAALAALRDPAGRGATLSSRSIDPRPDVPVRPEPPLDDEVRRAVWESAGLVRQAERLEPLAASSVTLVRLLAACALARRESRGGHFRLDFPEPDPALDGYHTLVRGDGQPVFERWT